MVRQQRSVDPVPRSLLVAARQTSTLVRVRVSEAHDTAEHGGSMKR